LHNLWMKDVVDSFLRGHVLRMLLRFGSLSHETTYPL
jgi:hypothetical protein